MSLSPLLTILLQAAAPEAVPAALDLPVCLSRTVKDARGQDRQFPVIVDLKLSTELLTKGFSVVGCSATKWSAAKYRAEMCRLGEGNSAVQARLEQVVGVKPRRLCETAKGLGSALDRLLASAN